MVFETRKAMALLAHLALADRPRSREALCELLYPGHEPERARGALRRTLSTLRKGDRRGMARDRAATASRCGGARVWTLDVERFRRWRPTTHRRRAWPRPSRCSRAASSRASRCATARTFDDWQLGQAGALERELASALRRLVEQLAARGDFERAIPHARRWLALDPLHEPAHRELIRLHAWSGDRAAALEQYRSCVRTLSQELGVAPLEETAALYEQVNDGTLAPPAQASRSRGAAQPRPCAGAAPSCRSSDATPRLAALLDAHAAAAARRRGSR